MPVALRSASTGTATASGAVSVSAPAGVVSTDLLIAVHFEDLFGTTAAMTAPSGFTQVGTTHTGGTTTPGSAHVKVWQAPGSQTAPYSFGQDDTSAITVLAISGQDGTTPINITPVYASTASSQALATTSSITPTVNGCLVVAGFATTANSGTPTWTPPGGYTEQSDLFPSFVTAEVATLIQATAGATGALTATCSVTTVNEHVAVAFAIAPASGGGGGAAPLRQPIVGTSFATMQASTW